MAKNRRRTSRAFTLDERIALVTEIERRYRAGAGPLAAIARELGTSDSNYYSWVRSGIRPRASEPVKPARKAASPRYTEAERKAFVAKVDGQVAAGQSVKTACKQVGISDKSYRNWRDAAAPPPEMRPVEVTALVPVAPAALVTPSEQLAPMLALVPSPPTREPAGLSLMAPGGYRIEGLAVETAAALLRALAC